MAVFYLIDPADPQQSVVNVVQSAAGTVDIGGLIAVKTAAPLRTSPTTLSDVLVAKRNVLLANADGLSRILLDACLSSSTVVTGSYGTANVSAKVMVGMGYANHCIMPGGTLVATGTLAAVPTQCAVFWETYTVVDEDPMLGRFTRLYTETGPGVLTGNIAFTAGGTQTPVTSGTRVSVTGATTSFFVLLQNNTVNRVYIGSWAVLY